MRYFLLTLGCPKNLVDSEICASALREEGFEPTTSPADSDVIIINACGFLDESRQEGMEYINEMRKYGKKLVVMGCLPSRLGKDARNIPADIVVGVGRYHEIGKIIRKYINSNEKVVIPSAKPTRYLPAKRINTLSPYSAYVKIAEGCSRRCTFCSIPLIRGKMVSRSMDDIVREVRELAESGVKEFILISQDTLRWGRDTGENFYKLLDRISEYAPWIRLYYIYPEREVFNLIRYAKENDRIVRYIELPFQHISTRLLKLMGRASDEKLLREISEKLKEEGFTIRTEFIVGFPTETDEEFEKLVDFVREYEFDWIGVFTYSPEKGTASFKLHVENPVPRKVALERQKELYGVWSEILEKRQREKLGKVFEVIKEGEENGKTVARAYFQAPEIDGVFVVREKGKVVKGKEHDKAFFRAKVVGFDGPDLFAVEVG